MAIHKTSVTTWVLHSNGETPEELTPYRSRGYCESTLKGNAILRECFSEEYLRCEDEHKWAATFLADVTTLLEDLKKKGTREMAANVGRGRQ